MADPRGTSVALEVRRRHLTYLALPALLDLARFARNLAVGGAIIEAGTALGGSAIILANAKSVERPLRLYDTFGLIPPPSDRDGPDVHKRYADIQQGRAAGIGGELYYGYRDDLRGDVQKAMASFGISLVRDNVSLVPGLYEETLEIDEAVALAHVDCDWYESVTVCLERIWPNLQPTGRIIVDDYDSWSGCREAVDRFLGQTSGCTIERHARVHLVRQS